MGLPKGGDDLVKHLDDQLDCILSRIVEDIGEMSPAELDAAKGYRMNAEFFWKSFEASVDLVVSDGWSKWPSMREIVRDEVPELIADTPQDLKKVKKELKKRRDKNFKDMLALSVFLKSPEGPNFAGHLANYPRYEEERKARTEKVRADVLKRRPQIEVSFILLKVLSEALEKV